jgi:hypothetical protein
MKLAPAEPRYTNLGIKALRRGLPSSEATERFWQHVSQVGTPLVEPIPAIFRKLRNDYDAQMNHGAQELAEQAKKRLEMPAG